MDQCRLFFALTLDVFLDVELLLGNDYLEHALGVVIPNGNLEVLVHIVENEKIGKVLGHVESQILVVVVGSVVDCIVLDNTDGLETAFVGVRLHDNRVLVVSVIILVHRQRGNRLWLYSLKLLYHHFH